MPSTLKGVNVFDKTIKFVILNIFFSNVNLVFKKVLFLSQLGRSESNWSLSCPMKQLSPYVFICKGNFVALVRTALEAFVLKRLFT